jgi:glutamate synthase (NADPH/NADH) small chain
MGDPVGFKKYNRKTIPRRKSTKRIGDWKEIYTSWSTKESHEQSSRCMDCGIPFCNNGCPLGNLIPEFNELVSEGNWEEAIVRLHSTNNFPEFTGRICPAPCEAACTLSINSDPVTIEMIEKTITDTAWDNGWIKPEKPKFRTNKNIAVVGSGPAGLAAAQQLNRAGHYVTVFERNEVIGGLLSIGIPEFKLEKKIVNRRIDQMKKEGIKFQVNTDVGVDIKHSDLIKEYDAICLAGGSTVPRDLNIKGRDQKGIHFAMDYLSQQNSILRGDKILDKRINAKDKNVVIIGGGDTGADCLGTSIRQNAKNIIQIEILPRPPIERNEDNPWPNWPMIFKSSSAHEEGGERDYNILTKSFISDSSNNVKQLECVRVEWIQESNKKIMKEIPNSNFKIEAELVLIAMGFTNPQHEGLLNDLKLNYDDRGNVKANEKMQSNIDKIFTCGDMHRGQSLVVHAIASGRKCARNIDVFLEGKSSLPSVQEYIRSM